MILWLTAAIVAVLSSPAKQEPAPTPLSEAIKVFNARAADDPVGKSQPELTEDEVLAAIRWWEFRRENAPVTNSQFAEFQNIVRTKTLPAGTQFEVLRGYQPTNQVEFTAWSVRIRMPHGMGSYAYEIRERMISWRPIGPEERKVMEEWNRRGIGSFERPRYFRELQDARKKDEAVRKPNP